MVGVNNRIMPNEDDFILCAENKNCVLEDRVPRWLKLRCRSPVEGKYLLIIKTRTPSKPLSIAEIRVKDMQDTFIEMKPGGIYVYKLNNRMIILKFYL